MNPADQPSGPARPFRFDPATGGVAVARGPAKQMDDVRILLSTRLGERLMRRDYGTRLPALVHDPNDDVLIDIARDQTQEALLRWEPRVAPAVVTAGNDPELGQATIRVDLNLPADTPALTIPLGRDRR